MVLFLLHLLGLPVRFEIWTITAIVLAVENEATFERGRRNCSNQQKWK